MRKYEQEFAETLSMAVDEDERDGVIARKRLAEIAEDPGLVVTGKALEGRLRALLT